MEPLKVQDFATLIVTHPMASDEYGRHLTLYVSVTPALVWYELTKDGKSLGRYRDIESAVEGWNTVYDIHDTIHEDTSLEPSQYAELWP